MDHAISLLGSGAQHLTRYGRARLLARSRVIRIVIALVTLLSMLGARQAPASVQAQTVDPFAGLQSVGGDYVHPSHLSGNCSTDWTWLQRACYNNSLDPASSTAPGHAKDRLQQELNFINANHLGNFQRLWVSVDQLGSFPTDSNGHLTSDTTFTLDPQVEGDLQDALKTFANANVKVDLVLVTIAPNPPSSDNTSCGAVDDTHVHEFRPEILANTNPAYEQNYLSAVQTVMANDIVPYSGTVSVVDLENEAFQQLEYYFCTGTSDNTRLGTYTASCFNGTGVDTTCVDTTIILPWLKNLRAAALQGDPNHLLTYTVSDTHRLLGSGDTPNVDAGSAEVDAMVRPGSRCLRPPRLQRHPLERYRAVAAGAQPDHGVLESVHSRQAVVRG